MLEAVQAGGQFGQGVAAHRRGAVSVRHGGDVPEQHEGEPPGARHERFAGTHRVIVTDAVHTLHGAGARAATRRADRIRGRYRSTQYLPEAEGPTSGVHPGSRPGLRPATCPTRGGRGSGTVSGTSRIQPAAHVPFPRACLDRLDRVAPRAGGRGRGCAVAGGAHEKRTKSAPQAWDVYGTVGNVGGTRSRQRAPP